MPINDGLTDLDVNALDSIHSRLTRYMPVRWAASSKAWMAGRSGSCNDGLTDLNILVLAIDHQMPSTLYAGMVE